MNILLEIEYDGNNYSGWQYQPNKSTVQGEIEQALKKIHQKKIKVIGASRTDAGVSALSQIANFHIESLRFESLKLLRAGLNAILPRDIFIKKIKRVAKDFNSRFFSKTKIYQYKIINQRLPLKQRFAWTVLYVLDIHKIKKAANLFIKQKDYAAFCSVKDKDGKVLMKSITIKKNKDEIFIKIEADRFLYKMVRRIVGALVDVGRGHRSEDDIERALNGEKHRPLICAPANGLTLIKVKY